MTRENAAFEAFHNSQHRYSAHHGKSPDEMTASVDLQVPTAGYVTPTTLPRQGRIEVVRFVRSDQRLQLLARTSPSMKPRPTATSQPSCGPAGRPSPSSPSTVKSCTWAASRSAPNSADRNDVLQPGPLGHHRNDVLLVNK